MQGFGEIISLESVEILKRKKIILYRQIKELEMEYDIGNLESEDFKNRRAELKSEVSLIIDKIKILTKLNIIFLIKLRNFDDRK